MQMTMDFEEKAVICAFLFHFRKKRRRKTWVQPLISRSLLKGQFHKLNDDLCAGIFPTSIINFSASQ